MSLTPWRRACTSAVPVFPPAAALAGLLGILSVATPANAQQTIPRELAEAFVRGYSPGDSAIPVQFFPGEIAPAIAPVISLPPNTQVIGSVTVAQTTSVFGTSTLAPDSALAWFAREYGRRGWPALAMMRVTGIMNMGGFRPAPSARPTVFCNETSQIAVGAVRMPAGFTAVSVRYTRNAPACTMFRAQAPPPRTVPQPVLPLPTLYDPPGATEFTPQCSMAASRQQSQAQLLASGTPQVLFDAYDHQLQAQGWQPMADTGTVASGQWVRRDSLGTTELATMMIGTVPGAPACRMATLDVMTLRKP